MLQQPYVASSRRLAAVATVAAASQLASVTATATEGGNGHYLPGATATLIDLVPTKPGLVTEAAYLRYEGDASISRSLPIAGVVTLGPEATSDAALFGAFYTLPNTVLGANYSVGAFVPYVWISVEATLSTPLGNVRRKDKASGVGDITLIPAMLAWKSGNWQYSALLPIYAPTGKYETGRLANPGLNYWTFDPTVGVSYNNQKTGFNAALYAGISLNTRNDDTDYQSGDMLHFDGSVQQLLPVGPGFLGIGAEFFYLDQIDGDSGSGARFGGFKGRTMGIGPVLSYILPRGKTEAFVAELRWLHESNVKNRLEGDFIWLKMVYQF